MPEQLPIILRVLLFEYLALSLFKNILVKEVEWSENCSLWLENMHLPLSLWMKLILLDQVRYRVKKKRNEANTILVFSFSNMILARGGGRGDSEVQRTMLELLNQLDGFESTKDIKVRLS